MSKEKHQMGFEIVLPNSSTVRAALAKKRAKDCEEWDESKGWSPEPWVPEPAARFVPIGELLEGW